MVLVCKETDYTLFLFRNIPPCFEEKFKFVDRTFELLGVLEYVESFCSYAPPEEEELQQSYEVFQQVDGTPQTLEIPEEIPVTPFESKYLEVRGIHPDANEEDVKNLFLDFTIKKITKGKSKCHLEFDTVELAKDFKERMEGLIMPFAVTNWTQVTISEPQSDQD